MKRTVRVGAVLLCLLALAAVAWQWQARWRTPALTVVMAQGAAAPETETSFRVLLGMTDTATTVWDGALELSAGRIVRVEPWRFDDNDKIEDLAGAATAARWKLSARPMRAFNSSANPISGTPLVVCNGVIVTLRDAGSGAEAVVRTRQGDFRFRPAGIAYGQPVKFLEGRAQVDRVPATVAMARTPQEEDYPAAATDRSGGVWVAWQQFTPNPKFNNIRWTLPTGGTAGNLDELKEVNHGDQIMLARYTNGAWSAPIAVSEGRGDLFRPAVAVDGAGRVWVFWSANTNGNFDLYARVVDKNTAGKTLKLTADAGPDVTPVAATDARGQVWVAWQAFRNGRAQIHAASQKGDAFSNAIVVAATSANEWNPAIAAAASGEVSIAWDTYRKGDYDVYARTYDRDGKPGAEWPLAASLRYEAYPSLAYDPGGRLWVAWEESDVNWGKDFGADETTGIGLYHGRWLRVQAWQGGRVFAAPEVGAVLPGAGRQRVDAPSRQADTQQGAWPDPEMWKNRARSLTPQPPQRPRNSYPRLLAGGDGRIFMAYRTALPTWWSGVGTVWFENVVSLDGAAWSNPVFIPHSDNLLDNRPALASTAAGELLLVGSGDGRQQFVPGVATYQAIADPYNNDLYASRIVMPGAVKPMQLQPAPTPAVATPGQTDTANARRLREHRVAAGGRQYRIVRGEFHRHTEISMDGGTDGSIWDSFRYMLDAAAMDWVGCCDHDNGHGREYTWWMTQKLSDLFHLPGMFTPMFSYERSVQYPEGHRNIIFAQRGIRTLPRMPRSDEAATGPAPDTQFLYKYLRHFNGIVASHTSGTNMGTDWRDNDPLVEPIVEIYQGDRQNYEMPDAPRSNNAKDSIGGWREKGFVSLALEKGYKLGFQASSDHVSTHMSYCNLLVTETSRKGILEAFQKRHVYGATDDILADVRSGAHLMGDQFETSTPPQLQVRLTGTAPFAKVVIVRDNKYVYSIEPKTAVVQFSWRDEKATPGKQSYYYVRGEQTDGELVWASPMWITYKGR
ncbi:MAG: hypothetical protein ACKV2V_29380 [Blastocatellia bacterium]